MPQFLQNLQRYANNPLEFVNGVVRVGSMIGNELEYGRKQISGFIEDVVPEPVLNTLDYAGDLARTGYEASPVGKLDQGAAIAADAVSETTGVPALGMAAGLLLGMVDGVPGVNVSKGGARFKFKTQGEFNVTQPARIDAARDAVDNAKLILRNIEEANPGVKPGVLRKTIPEYKAAQKALGAKNPEVSSAESTLLPFGLGREQAYPRTKPRAKEIKSKFIKDARRELQQGIDQVIEQVDLHHKFPKGISAAFFNRGRDLIEDGKMTYNELVDMAKRAQKRGLEPGDVETNLEPMFKTPHDTFHAEMRAQGSNQFPGNNLEISKTKLTQKLRQVKSKKDLDALWDEMLADDVQYLYETASIWQPMDKVIKEISPKFTGKAKSKPK
tara:strand:- start:49 stop:1203 length:1155 start_codon:yes stop_codon:yes gene_type:complete